MWTVKSDPCQTLIQLQFGDVVAGVSIASLSLQVDAGVDFCTSAGNAETQGGVFSVKQRNELMGGIETNHVEGCMWEQ